HHAGAGRLDPLRPGLRRPPAAPPARSREHRTEAQRMTTNITNLSVVTADPKCGNCDGSLTDSPSAEFCSEDCQHTWQTEHAGTDSDAATDGGTGPDAQLVESAPVRPLSWLGPAPAGAFVRTGDQVLDAVAAFVGRFTSFPDEHCLPAVALWIAHTHVIDA